MRFLKLFSTILFTIQLNLIKSDYEQDCHTVGPLGMIRGEIKDHQISASSTQLKSWTDNCKASQARLYLENRKSWCAKFKSFSEWLQIDLGTESVISGVMTQGRGDGAQWIASFMISYSSDGTNFHYIKDDYGSQKVFQGNRDSFSVKHNYFNEKIRARFIKFHTYSFHGHPSLRVEILGCQPCKELLGVFPYGKITSSGSRGKKKHRTCTEEYGHILSNKGWCAKKQNKNQWIQIDIGQPSLITAIVTKGRGDSKQPSYVTEYQVSYSNNSKNWYYYKENSESGPNNVYMWWLHNGTVFKGNDDSTSEKIQYLREPFVARFTRIHPINWKEKIGMRIGVLGCKHKGECGKGFLKINDVSPCIANIAYKKPAWITMDSSKMQKRNIGYLPSDRRNQYSKNANKAVDGHTQWEINTEDQNDSTNIRIEPISIRKQHMKTCTVLQYKSSNNFNPVWYVNLGEQTTVNGVVIYNGYDILFGDKTNNKFERDQVENVDKISVFVDQHSSKVNNHFRRTSDLLCGSVTRFNNALSKPKVHISCLQPMSGQFVYIQATGIKNRRRTDYKAILCEVMVY